ncbi:choline dehydrogenase [Aspergillus sclerotioniger CBS 115572]|uniref:Choline dehydrogenase n=1 Tax=Aspergillus sclerotioniger CBS 115572 TaxID=1450535 RepID=A0A317VNT4_9EURO|nr:choline dehydrogenase [Aspergillus sclerotioniger CBS 115572]PWY74528.1 choline dehydrogenase [Aspergillus sclerotioniger CBS 115572]
MLYLLLLLATETLSAAVHLTGYEYIVVGSGAGGGPLAARLALAGHQTLLLEAGDDQGLNLNYTVPGYGARAAEDKQMAWNFFVRHYADDTRQALDHKTTYITPTGDEYVGVNPPPGSIMKGILYPRTNALGGCTAHNALVAIYPHRSDFEYLANLTGDDSWSPNNMRQYFIKLENNRHVLPGIPGHGYDGWLSIETAPINLVLQDPQFLSLVLGGAFALGNLTNTIINLVTLLAGDANTDSATRDSQPAYYQIPISTSSGRRNGAREFLLAVHSATNPDGTQTYPLTIRTNCHATRVLFDTTSSPPIATGVSFLDGAYLYHASPLSSPSRRGTPGTATASREVIISGGVYNSPQLLKLSGIGPAAELTTHHIPVLVDLLGVGTNLQDHYEISVVGQTPKNLSALAGCTFNELSDPCLTRWENPTPITHDRGIYSSVGFATTMFYKSNVTSDNNYDLFIFDAPINFRGYFPGFGVNVTAQHNWFTWSMLKSHPRNRAGSVTLRSNDPLDVPDILFNYFDTGSEGYEKDLQAMYEAVKVARDAFARQAVPIDEVLPGAAVQTKEEIVKYIKDMTWGHHASCTCPIGADDDPMAVLDSKFRVRGVRRLRVVDGSVFPRIPGTFPAVSTYMIGEKAAVDILNDIQ